METTLPTQDKPALNDSLLATLSSQLSAIEKRDGELWFLVVGTGVVVGIGLLALLFPVTFFREGALHLEVTLSRELFFGLGSLLVLFNLYVISRRFEFRKVRQQLISATLQNELIRLQSFTDPLTEVYNRRSLDDMAGRLISSAKRHKTPLTVLVIDVDRFKQVNTKFGHLTGDVVLAEISAILRGSVRGSDVVVRYGGDEFMILLPEATKEDSLVVVNRIHTNLEAWNDQGHLANFRISLSVGVAQWKDGETINETLDTADREMYSVKPTGQPV